MEFVEKKYTFVDSESEIDAKTKNFSHKLENKLKIELFYLMRKKACTCNEKGTIEIVWK